MSPETAVTHLYMPRGPYYVVLGTKAARFDDTGNYWVKATDEDIALAVLSGLRRQPDTLSTFCNWKQLARILEDK